MELKQAANVLGKFTERFRKAPSCIPLDGRALVAAKRPGIPKADVFKPHN